MTVEERLRRSFGAAVEQVDAPPWSPRTFRSGPSRPRRFLAVVGFAVVLAIVFAVYIAIDRGTDRVRPSSSAVYPSRIAAMTADGRLVVLSSRDGRVIRTLARDAVPAPAGQSSLAVTPDGKTIYYQRSLGTACGSGPRDNTAIAAISVHGGRQTSILQFARSPAVSPDGRYLAATGIPNCSDSGDAIILRDLSSHVHARPYDKVWYWSLTRPPSLGIVNLSWAPHARHLAFVPLDFADISPRVLDISSVLGLNETPILVGVGGWQGYRGITGDSLVVHAPDPRTPFATKVGSVDAAGNERTLFTVHAACCTITASSDRSGRNIVVARWDKAGAALFRWSIGDRKPTKIAGGIVAAAWVP